MSGGGEPMTTDRDDDARITWRLREECGFCNGGRVTRTGPFHGLVCPCCEGTGFQLTPEERPGENP